MEDKKLNIAILIDGDNAQAKLLKEVIDEVSKYGKATIRRIYGDWTSTTMNSWKETLNQHSVSPIQKFSYTTGKNSTDGALIIDAMDILHSKNVKGFCIVSSDSDYTGLAKRIREEGLFVIGIGEKKTPEAFVKSCDVFTYTENISPAKETQSAKTTDVQPATPRKQVTKRKISISKEDLETISKAFDISADENELAYISKIGINIRKIDPSFDVRSYGYSSLSKFFAELNNYEVIENKIGELNHPLLKKKLE